MQRRFATAKFFAVSMTLTWDDCIGTAWSRTLANCYAEPSHVTGVLLRLSRSQLTFSQTSTRRASKLSVANKASAGRTHRYSCKSYTPCLRPWRNDGSSRAQCSQCQSQLEDAGVGSGGRHSQTLPIWQANRVVWPFTRLPLSACSTILAADWFLSKGMRWLPVLAQWHVGWVITKKLLYSDWKRGNKWYVDKYSLSWLATTLSINFNMKDKLGIRWKVVCVGGVWAWFLYKRRDNCVFLWVGQLTLQNRGVDCLSDERQKYVCEFPKYESRYGVQRAGK